MRRKRRRSIKWGKVFLVLLLANVAAGLYVSPATATRYVRVVGARQEDMPYIREVLRALRDRPFFRLDGSRIESRILALSPVKSATIERNVLGRAVLTLSYRTPVATLAGSALLKLGEDGELYADGRQVVGLPNFEIPQAARFANLSLAFPVELKAVVDIARRLQAMGMADDTTIAVQEGGQLWLNRGDGAQIVLGSSDKLDEKFAKFKAYLDESPTGLSRVAELNLTVPERPTIIPRGAGR